jgi:hypothetical protein
MIRRIKTAKRRRSSPQTYPAAGVASIDERAAGAVAGDLKRDTRPLTSTPGGEVVVKSTFLPQQQAR